MQASARCASWWCALRSLRPVCLLVSWLVCATRRVSLRGAQHMFVFLPVLLVAALRAGLCYAARMPL
ncbi:hypothetical protein A2U01_0056704, partial [Trifolium medium]|nr:hypothetical protein [Trifolium medium]